MYQPFEGDVIECAAIMGEVKEVHFDGMFSIYTKGQYHTTDFLDELTLLKSPHLESLDKRWEDLTRKEQCGLVIAQQVFGLKAEKYFARAGWSMATQHFQSSEYCRLVKVTL